MSKRILALEKMIAGGSTDPFARYALALEYKSAGRADDAFTAFQDLRSSNPDYLAMYLMCGQLLKELGRTPEARKWLTAGIAVATAQPGPAGDKALHELQGLLEELAD